MRFTLHREVRMTIDIRQEWWLEKSTHATAPATQAPKTEMDSRTAQPQGRAKRFPRPRGVSLTLEHGVPDK